VINGCSDLLVEVFGEWESMPGRRWDAGLARRNPVEIEMILEVG